MLFSFAFSSYCSNLKIATVHSSEMSVNLYQTTLRYVPEGNTVPVNESIYGESCKAHG
jgi:hypothetical protein